MADILKIYKKCERCNGTGTDPFPIQTPDPTDDPRNATEGNCIFCNGQGEYEWGRVKEIEL